MRSMQKPEDMIDIDINNSSFIIRFDLKSRPLSNVYLSTY